MPKTSRRDFIRAAGLAATGLAAAAPGPTNAAPPRAATPASMPERFRALLRGSEPVHCIGVHDVLSARLVEMHGFPSVFIGGSAAAGAGHALPDIGLVSTTELVEFAARITANIDIPALADADDAGGTPLDVYRNAKAFERAGVAAVMYEDRIRVDRLRGVARVSPVNEVVDRICAAKDSSPDLLCVLRTELLPAKLSMEETLARGAAFAQAGADLIFFAGMKVEDHPRAAQAVGIPLYGSFHLPLDRLKAARIKLAVYTLVMQDIAMGAVHNALLELKTTGALTNAEKGALSNSVEAQLLRTQGLGDLARKYNFRT